MLCKILCLVLLYIWAVIKARAMNNETSGCSLSGGELVFLTVQCQHGVCETHRASDGTYIDLCHCNRHYSGRHCEHANSVCSRVNCKHGSSCEIDGCVCSPLHSADDCSQVLCKDSQNYCKNGGLCYNGECVCPSHTEGTHCELTVCGDNLCTGGYCMLDHCECDVACVIGCDSTTGICKTTTDNFEDSLRLSSTMRILLIVVVVVVMVIIIPALYAMYNMRIENQLRNERLNNHYEMEKRYQEAYIAAQGRTSRSSGGSTKERPDGSRSSTDGQSVTTDMLDDNLLEIKGRKDYTRKSVKSDTSRKRSDKRESAAKEKTEEKDSKIKADNKTDTLKNNSQVESPGEAKDKKVPELKVENFDKQKQPTPEAGITRENITINLLAPPVAIADGKSSRAVSSKSKTRKKHKSKEKTKKKKKL